MVSIVMSVDGGAEPEPEPEPEPYRSGFANGKRIGVGIDGDSILANFGRRLYG